MSPQFFGIARLLVDELMDVGENFAEGRLWLVFGNDLENDRDVKEKE